MLKYIIVIILALIVGQGVYVGYYAVKAVNQIKANQQYQKEVYDYEDAVIPIRKWDI